MQDKQGTSFKTPRVINEKQVAKKQNCTILSRIVQYRFTQLGYIWNKMDKFGKVKTFLYKTNINFINIEMQILKLTSTLFILWYLGRGKYQVLTFLYYNIICAIQIISLAKIARIQSKSKITFFKTMPTVKICQWLII